MIRRFCGALRLLAGGDGEVVALIDTYACGCDDRADVMQRLGWTLPKFINVRRRLSTLIGHLPDDLRAAAMDAVTRHSSVIVQNRPLMIA